MSATRWSSSSPRTWPQVLAAATLEAKDMLTGKPKTDMDDMGSNDAGPSGASGETPRAQA